MTYGFQYLVMKLIWIQLKPLFSGDLSPPQTTWKSPGLSLLIWTCNLSDPHILGESLSGRKSPSQAMDGYGPWWVSTYRLSESSEGFPGSPIVPWLLSIRRCLWRYLEDGPNNHRVVKSWWKKCDVRHIFVLALSQITWYFSCRSSLGMNPVWFWPMNLLRNALELNYPKNSITWLVKLLLEMVSTICGRGLPLVSCGRGLSAWQSGLIYL